MLIHPPKHLSTRLGLGLPNTRKQLELTGPHAARLTEVWQDMPNGEWRQESTVIARPGFIWVSEWVEGQSYVTSQFFNPDRTLIATYIDISRPVTRANGDFEFDDLYLDVWMPAGGPAELLDSDELEAAVQAGFVSSAEAATAHAVAAQLIRELTKG